jgi:CIC family chloride channel protein
VPVAGAVIIGLMARYGSERIRGHGIPEAIESILINGSRVEPRLAILKPLSSAISIGSGGPFGAEGPIIMTGGAFGSMIAQFFHLTSAERKTLLVAGAAGGMSATFAAPLAAVLAGGGASVVRMEAAQPGSGSAGERHGMRSQEIYHRARSVVSGSGA